MRTFVEVVKFIRRKFSGAFPASLIRDQVGEVLAGLELELKSFHTLYSLNTLINDFLSIRIPES